MIKKVIKKKGDKLHVKWKGYNNCFNNLIKMILLYKISYYPEPISHIKNRTVELDFYNHVSKSDV